MAPDIARSFEYENGFYLTATVPRFSKFVAHLDLFRTTSELRGEIVECGVFKGASLSRLIKFRNLIENPWSRRIIAFDTFGTFPDATPEDSVRRADFVRQAGDQSISKVDLSELLTRIKQNDNVELIEGDIAETAAAYCTERPELRLSLLHVDVDLYEPTKVSLETFYPRLVPGGICILDDFGAFPGATRAIEEYFANAQLPIKRLSFAGTIAYVQKPVSPECRAPNHREIPHEP